ncbi:MAG: flavin reductase family protein [Phycisphaerales bacterium]|nr:flavin reductase family protein [Phycisphaerales bacterium]
MEIDPSRLSPSDRYRLLIGAVVPRPIAVVGTRSPCGRFLNLAPFSFFNACGSEPMTLMFCPANRDDGSEKDTLRNCLPAGDGGSGEFTVSVATEPIIRQVVAAAEELPPESSEFALSGLTPVAGARVQAPRVGESPVSFECRTRQVIRLAHGAPAGANIVIGDVVHVHVADGVLDAHGKIDPGALRAVGRMGSMCYALTRDVLEIPFGARALAAGGNSNRTG